MPLPRSELGLVVHYGFVWSGADRTPPPDAGKDRPCLIVDLFEVEDVPGRKTIRVIYLPISHNAPREGQHAMTISRRVAQHLGLMIETSYLYTTYACEDDWPFDLSNVPGQKGRFHYGLIPPKLFDPVVGEFRHHLSQRPDLVHRPSS
jgi:hypothetical protein